MQSTYSNIFSSSELEFLKADADDYGWYVWTDETRSIIQGLCARRLMAANGDFKVVAKNGERQVNLSGHGARPSDTVLRYYELVGVGRIAFHALQHEHQAFPAPAAAMAEKSKVSAAHS